MRARGREKRRLTRTTAATVPAVARASPSSLRSVATLSLPARLGGRAGGGRGPWLSVPLLGRDRPQAALEIVEDETRGRLRPGHSHHRALPVADDEHAPLGSCHLQLDESRPELSPSLAGSLEERLASLDEPAGSLLVGERGGECGALSIEHGGGSKLGRDLGKVAQSSGGIHRVVTLAKWILPDVLLGAREIVAKFQADRGTQLAAMIAYYALLSFVPLTFLALSLLGLFGRADESSYLVRELARVFPQSSVSTIVKAVREIQKNATALGVVGLALLLWSSLSLFGALESALNIVYGRPNRPFLRGKAVAAAIMLGLLVLLFGALLLASFGYGQLRRHAPGFASHPVVAAALPVLGSVAASFVFLLAVYYFLTNVDHTLGDVLPGALAATLVLGLTFQALPVYLRLSSNTPALQAFGGPVILLVWLYVMANVIVLGAELNWWRQRGRVAAETRSARDQTSQLSR
ncbi:MAG: hypothetical protein C4307_03705 [Chloroflexota bacterium]